MDKGTWTFRCRKCRGTFELIVSEEERASEFARKKPCPSCGLLPSDPDEARAMVGERAHKVIGYRPERNTRPFIV